MAAMDPKYDSALMGILSNEGEIYKFLDAVLGFLYRRTDFFRLLTKDGKLGFPPGSAANILMKEFSKYEKIARNEEREIERKTPIKDHTSTSKSAATLPLKTSTPSSSAPLANTSTPASTEHKATPSDITEPVAATVEATTSATAESVTTDTGDHVTCDTDDHSTMDTDDHTGDTDDHTGDGDGIGDDDSKDTDTEEDRQQAAFQDNPISYNGAIRDNYAWSQSITDVDVRVFVPDNIKKGKQVKVDIDKKHLRVCYYDDSGAAQTPADGDLTWEVNKEECMWSLVPGEHVHVSLEKHDERWWEATLVGEAKINVRKIDCSRPMTDLDDEAQAKIGELMYNEQQKRLGLPQSHEQKSHDMLRQAWDAEGSPFKGQPFDPSVLNVNSGGVISYKPS